MMTTTSTTAKENKRIREKNNLWLILLFSLLLYTTMNYGMCSHLSPSTPFSLIKFAQSYCWQWTESSNGIRALACNHQRIKHSSATDFSIFHWLGSLPPFPSLSSACFFYSSFISFSFIAYSRAYHELYLSLFLPFGRRRRREKKKINEFNYYSDRYRPFVW